jgi:hypothetical protein
MEWHLSAVGTEVQAKSKNQKKKKPQVCQPFLCGPHFLFKRKKMLRAPRLQHYLHSF